MTREEAIEHLRTIAIYSFQDGYTDEARKALDMAIKALEEPERKKGKWIDDGKGLYMCSSCGKFWMHWWARVVPLDRMCKELRYCPMCGADMRER